MTMERGRWIQRALTPTSLTPGSHFDHAGFLYSLLFLWGRVCQQGHFFGCCIFSGRLFVNLCNFSNTETLHWLTDLCECVQSRSLLRFYWWSQPTNEYGDKLGSKPFSRCVYCLHLFPSWSFMHDMSEITFSRSAFVFQHLTSMNTVINVRPRMKNTTLHAEMSHLCHTFDTRRATKASIRPLLFSFFSKVLQIFHMSPCKNADGPLRTNPHKLFWIWF